MGEALVYAMKMKIHYTVVENDTNFTHDVLNFEYVKLSMTIVIINRGVTAGKGGKKPFSPSEINLGEIHFYKTRVLKPCKY